ncbi:MAG: restriction endonuclease [Candidatus Staskawiczbacteria bacterium]|nr:restriction endonuclease [Candidatus Staskawiczbacteria bacterium]
MSKLNIDILENTLRRIGNLLDILLIDRTTKKNIIWATDSYEKYGQGFLPELCITPNLVTGKYGLLIQPRASKSLEEQKKRTKDKAEVFTPLKIIDQINKETDMSGKNFMSDKNNWQEYVRELKLEITCGEAPFIASRYNPTAHTGKLIKLDSRVGFLDKKLKIVSKHCHKKGGWLFWAKVAFMASYGYEWQGDNVLLARENLLYTLIDYYKDKFKRSPDLRVQEEFAEIISWNIFQMDGLKYVVPMSCHHENKVIPGKLTLFGETPDTVEKYECEGCKYNRPNKHNGKYVKIMDWNKNKVIMFVELINNKLIEK